MTYLVTKTYDHNEGLSVAFRQWRAKSHCHFIHGYSLAFEFTFASENLDELNWVIDFGSLKALRAWLHEAFDHRLIVARDDPEYCMFEQLHDREIANVLFVNNVSCECFAEMAFNGAIPLINYSKGIYIDSVKVSEHSGNSATYVPAREIKWNTAARSQ